MEWPFLDFILNFATLISGSWCAAFCLLLGVPFFSANSAYDKIKDNADCKCCTERKGGYNNLFLD